MKDKRTNLNILFPIVLFISLIFAGSSQFFHNEPHCLDLQPGMAIQTGSAGLATADPDGEHSVYSWPFALEQMGHLLSSYQLYSGNLDDAYFHGGIDLRAQAGTAVHTPLAGQVVNIEKYNFNDLYWEVAILDPEGYVWQYHHIDKDSIPQTIHQAFAAWQADPQNGGFVPADSHLGDIVTWTEWSFGSYFHHIHLNILAAGDVYINPLEFLDETYPDTQAPEIQGIGLFSGTNSLLSGNSVPKDTDYSLYLHVRDLYMSEVYYLPPQRITYKINGGEPQLVWDFHVFPGGDQDDVFPNKLFLPGLTKGNYDARDFYIDLGFRLDGENPFPTEVGEYEIEVGVWDYHENYTTSSFTWLVTESIPDGGCIGNNGITHTFTIEQDAFIEDINLGIVAEHAKRGQIRVNLKGPQDKTAKIIVFNSGDENQNYNILVDDASNEKINNKKKDELFPTTFNREVGPSQNGILDEYIGLQAKGIWEVFVCDMMPGTTGQLYKLDLQIKTNNNQQPVATPQSLMTGMGQALPILLSGSDPEGAALSFEIIEMPKHGSLTGEGASWIYIPQAGYKGEDEFQFVANDGEKNSLPAMVKIMVQPLLFLPLIFGAN